MYVCRPYTISKNQVDATRANHKLSQLQSTCESTCESICKSFTREWWLDLRLICYKRAFHVASLFSSEWFAVQLILQSSQLVIIFISRLLNFLLNCPYNCFDWAKRSGFIALHKFIVFIMIFQQSRKIPLAFFIDKALLHIRSISDSRRSRAYSMWYWYSHL